MVFKQSDLKQRTMNLGKLHLLIVLTIELFHSGADGERLCSCYTFENKTSRMGWPQAMDSCKYNNKHLVVVETEREWKFIKNEIQNRAGIENDEWYIGLYRNLTTGNWTWINGKPLTIDKWIDYNPDDSDFYALIHKEYPVGKLGSFSSITGTVYRGWICEEETDACQGVCFYHNPVPTSTIPHVTTVATAQGKTSTGYDHTTASDSQSIPTTAVPPASRQKSDDSNSSIVVIVAASLAAVFFVMLIILVAVLLLRRKKRQEKDAERPSKKTSNGQVQSGENQYESVNHVEAAKLLGSPDRTRVPPDNKPSKIEHELPAPDCEYAVVNKANKKRKEGDLVYAQLAEFDAENDAASNPQKPPSYEPTVYADVDVMPAGLSPKENPDATQPTYANVETTGV